MEHGTLKYILIEEKKTEMALMYANLKISLMDILR